MKVPRQLLPLVQDGMIDEVIRPLMAGKEASVYMVIAQGEVCCAKVYKEATQRSFKNRAKYQEGRGTRNSRRARAMQRGSKFGKQEKEDDWQNAEVEALYRLADAGVAVPKPVDFAAGVLVMEMIVDADGSVAPRLNDVALTEETARAYFKSLLQDVVRMLCAGLIHGDLSEYNVLVGADGPVIIDLPQVVDAAANNSASQLLRRDVSNLAAYFSQFVPELGTPDFGREIWKLYENGELHPETELTGKFKRPRGKVDIKGVLSDIDDARKDADRRRGGRASSQHESDEDGPVVESAPIGGRRVLDLRPQNKRSGRGQGKPGGDGATAKTDEEAAPKKRRRRRRRRSGGGSDQASAGSRPSDSGRGQASVRDAAKPSQGGTTDKPKRRRRRRRKSPSPG
jgi:RIO kinase 1